MGSEPASIVTPVEPAEPICPACRRSLAAYPDMPPASGSVRKCPVHDLALIEPHEFLNDENDALLGHTIAGRFIVLGRLGKGSMGAVYRARQRTVGRDVALKIVRRDRALDLETKARFEREARAVSLLTSPHTITAFDFGEAEDGSWFLAMEMLEGETLGQRLRREQRLTTTAALDVARDALCSLSEAHSKGIIHRDLKPDNIFLSRSEGREGRREIAKLLDFGIAKWEHKRESFVDPLETLAGTVFGTPRYMSPEQAQGFALDARSDLYSLGVLLFHMLTGKPPFTDDDAVVVMARHIQDEPPRFRDVAPGCHISSAVEAVVRRAMSKSPDLRPQTAEDMRVALDAAEHTPDLVIEPEASGAQPIETPAPTPPAGRRILFVSITLLTFLAASGWIWALRRAPTPHSSAALPAVPSGLALSTPPHAQAPMAAPSVLIPAAPEAERTVQSESSAAMVAPTTSARTLHKLRSPKSRAVGSPSALLPRKANERYGRFE